MTDDREKLQATLRELKRQLDEASSLDADVAARLQAAIGDIEATLSDERPKRKPEGGLTERLSEATLEFEASHPTLAGAVGSVIDALGRMGI